MTLVRALIAFAVVLVLGCRSQDLSLRSVPERDAMRDELEAIAFAPVSGGDAVVNAPAVLRFHREGTPVWAGADLEEAVEGIRASGAAGLDPRDYHAPAIDRLLDDAVPSSRAALDVLVTDGALLLASHLARGKVEPVTGLARWDVLPAEEALLRDALDAHRVGETLARLGDHGPEYAALQEAYAAYRESVVSVEDDPLSRAARATLERMRWRGPPPERRVEVDLAAFRLRYLRPGESPVELRVMVGATDWATPILSSRIESIVFNPTWTVPRKIFEEELVEKLRRDPGWLERESVRVLAWNGEEISPDPELWLRDPKKIPVVLVQDPGPRNALGRVKFVFPNRAGIYLHDTPESRLFSWDVRAFTHGCIRVERAPELAAILSGRTPEDLDSLLADGETAVLVLDEPVPIEVVYGTAAVERGALVQRADVYGFDEVVLDALDAPAPAGPPSRGS